MPLGVPGQLGGTLPAPSSIADHILSTLPVATAVSISVVVSALPSLAASVESVPSSIDSANIGSSHSVVDNIPVVGSVIASGVTKPLPSLPPTPIASVVSALPPAVTQVESVVSSIVSAATKPIPTVIGSIVSRVTKSLPSPSFSIPLPLSSLPPLLSSPSPPVRNSTHPKPIPLVVGSIVSGVTKSLPSPSFPLPPSPSPSVRSSTPSSSTIGSSSPSAGPPFTGGNSSTSNGGGSPSLGSSSSSSVSGNGHPSLSYTTTLSPTIINSIVTGDKISLTSDNGSVEAPPGINIASNSIPAAILIQSDVIPSSLSSSSSLPSSNQSGLNNNGNPSAVNTHHQLSSGGITAIVIVAFFLFIALPITIFILHCRFNRRREERKVKWGFATTQLSQPYADAVDEKLVPVGTQMACSIDYPESGHIIPPPAVMVETGRGNAFNPAPFDENINESRFSIGSVGSTSSSQHLVYHQLDSTLLDLLGDTVRSLSLLESLALQLPEPAAACSRSFSVASTLSRPSSTETTSMSTATIVPRRIPPLTIEPRSSMPVHVDPFTDDNPFDDPTPPITSNSTQSDVYVIRRSFMPTLPNELKVQLNDNVKVLQTFHDGWGLIEKVGKDRKEGEIGSIPMDCLNEVTGGTLLQKNADLWTGV